MMTVDVMNPVELHAAGLRALNTSLGVDAAQAFIEQYFGGHGDYTAEKKQQPPMTRAELQELEKAYEAEAIAAGVAV